MQLMYVPVSPCKFCATTTEGFFVGLEKASVALLLMLINEIRLGSIQPEINIKENLI